MRDLVLRPYRPEDAPRLAEVFHAAVHAVPDDLYGPAARAAWSPRVDPEKHATRAARIPPLVATVAGEVVGFMSLEPDGHLDMAYVHPRHGRRGIATALYARLEADAEARRLGRLFAEVSDAARPFFEARGFVAQHANAVPRRGQVLRNWAMARRLVPFDEAPRVFVVGNSGAGKSTFAGGLEGRRHVDLDAVAFADARGTRRPLADSLDRLGDDLEGTVVEGCYADLVEALATPQDHLVWLDPPLETCLAHARARPWEPHKWASGEAQDAFLPRLLDFIGTYPERDDPTGRSAHAALFEGFVGVRERHAAPPRPQADAGAG
jgi:ribosomal protein S18 acetylase RimI-like enzyme